MNRERKSIRIGVVFASVISMTTLYQDLRYGLRLLWNSPGFTAVAVLTMAVGIAANTTVFSWIDMVLLQPRPGIAEGDRLATFESIEPNLEGLNISYPDYLDYRRLLKFSTPALTLFPNALNVGEGERTERVWGELVSGNYFEVLEVKPLLGRLFLLEEQAEKRGADPVAVISERLWRSHFQADPGTIGRTIRVNRRHLTIIGVTPAVFRGTMRGLEFNMWVPLTMAQQLNLLGETAYSNRKTRMFNAVARLKPGVPIEKARDEVAAIARQLATTHPNTNEGYGATLLGEWETHGSLQARLRAPLHILLAMCFLVLLIACVNVANLLLARATAREKEISIRLALGAGRRRLARQLLTEAMLLPALGVLAGVPLALWMQRSIVHLTPRMINVPIGVDTRLSGRVMVFTIVISLAAALIAGISPMLHAMRSDVNQSLRGGRGGTSGRQTHRLRGLFVISEVALALVTLVGAGLFVSSFQAASRVDPGFDARNVLVSEFHFSTSGYSPEQRKDFCEQLDARLRSQPGIEAVSYADRIPLGFGLGGANDLEIEGYVPARSENMTLGRTLVAPGYFGLMRIPLLEGQDFTERDTGDERRSIIVSESFARRFYGAQSPIGRNVRVGRASAVIVGLVKDSKCYNLSEGPRPYFFAPLHRTSTPVTIAFYVRTARAPGDVSALLRREAAAVDPEIGAFQTMLLSDYITGPLFPQKIAAVMLTALSVMALLLAAVGLYSVMTYAVSERTQEIGIRVALGAHPANVLTMVLGKAMGLAGVGVLIGVGAALAGARLVSGMLIGVSPTDPIVFVGAAFFLGLIGLLACCLPALRAARVDPVIALRNE